MQSADIINRSYRKPIDWQVLEYEFIANEDIDGATTWLRDVKGWDFKRIHSGNTQRHILEWGSKRAEIRRKIMAERREEAELLFREILPQLIYAKIKIFKYFDELLDRPQQLSLRDMSLILNHIKTELGEPIRITQSMAEGQQPREDPAKKVLEAMGLMIDGKVVGITDGKYLESGDKYD
ncbi:MAG TPA: hypothetical protein VL989_03085 [Candidatus Sulfotelmatobacter sp.]|nr:hypothetical protein [Candidatus Sulfotelmatobacter sp.]